MSQRSEERGDLVLPGTEVLPLRNALTQAINAQREAWLDLARKLHAHMTDGSEAGKEDRHKFTRLLKGERIGWLSEPSHFVEECIQRLYPGLARPAVQGVHDTDKWDRGHAIVRLLAGEHGEAKRRLRMPRKKDLPTLPIAKTWAWGNSVCSISIDPAKRTLHWEVPETKNAVEEAWASLIGRTLKARLRAIKWTRATGGTFNYSDEGLADSALDHGGSGISMRGYGPLGERATGIKADGTLMRPRAWRR